MRERMVSSRRFGLLKVNLWERFLVRGERRPLKRAAPAGCAEARPGSPGRVLRYDRPHAQAHR